MSRSFRVLFGIFTLIAVCLSSFSGTVFATTPGSLLIIIDPGHGGSDPGAVGASGTREKDVNLKIAQKLKSKLVASGYLVLMSREDDSTVSLRARVDYANSKRANVFVSIHNNSFPFPTANGTETYYSSIGAYGGSNLATQVQTGMVKYGGRRDRGAKDSVATHHGGLYVLNYTNMPAALVEGAFLSNPEEEALLKSDEFQDKIARGIYEGIINFLSARQYGYTMGNFDVPGTFAPGSTVIFDITVTNTGTLTWVGSGSNPVGLDYKWVDQKGAVVDYGKKYGLRVYPGSEVAPNGSYTFSLSIKAPATPGSYTLVIDMVHENVTWFADRGVAPFTKSVSVGNSAMIQIDSPASGATVSGEVLIGGWAVEANSTSGPGIDGVHIYLDGPAGSGVFLGAASYGSSRPDVAAALGGSQFTNSGFNLTWNTAGLTSGTHTLYIYAHSPTFGWGLVTRTVKVQTPTSRTLITIDTPAQGATVSGQVKIGGWAVEANSTSGPGIDGVHIYLDGPAGSGRFLGAASYGSARPDVAAALGGSQFTNSGYSLSWNTTGLSSGNHTLYIYAHSPTFGWGLVTRTVKVQAPTKRILIQIDSPASGATVSGEVTIGGWAVEANSTSGPGIDGVHIYLDGPAGSGVFLGAASYGSSRPDVAAALGGSQFTNSGYNLTWNTTGLTSGNHTLYIYAHSPTFGWGLVTRTVKVQTPTSRTLITIDTPAQGATVSGEVTIGGWAVEANSTSGPGIDGVHVYLDGPAGSGRFLGAASYGSARPDVAAALGGSQFTNSGFNLSWNTTGLTSGNHTLYIYAHSPVFGWGLVTRTVRVATP